MLIRSLRSFLALHRHGTIVAAAEKVHLSQAAVSVQLKNMADELGVALFERTRRSLEFTATGRKLVPLAEKMVSIYEEMRALDGPPRNRHQIGGVLSLGMINSALDGVLPRLLKGILQQNPRLDIKITAGISEDLATQVNRGALDMAIVTEPPQRFPANLGVHYLYSEPFALLMPKSTSDNAACTNIVRAFASGHPYIAFERNTWAGQLIDAFLLQHGIMGQPAMELNALSSIAALVCQGLGMSIVPLIRGASWHESPALSVVPLAGFERPVSLITRAANQHDSLTMLLLSAFESAR